MKEGDAGDGLYSFSWFSALPLPLFCQFYMTLYHTSFCFQSSLFTFDDSSQNGSQYSVEVHLQQGNQWSWPCFQSPWQLFTSLQPSDLEPPLLFSDTVVMSWKINLCIWFHGSVLVSFMQLTHSQLPYFIKKALKYPKYFYFSLVGSGHSSLKGVIQLQAWGKVAQSIANGREVSVSLSVCGCTLSAQQETLSTSALGHPIPPALLPVISAASLGTISSQVGHGVWTSLTQGPWMMVYL